MSLVETEILTNLMRQKLDCLTQLRTLSVKQATLVEAGELTALLKVLAGKQKLLAVMQELEEKMDPYRQQSPADRVWRTPAHRETCAQLVEQCQKLLAEILASEKQGEAALVRRRDETADLLQGAHTAARSRGAYAEQRSMRDSRLDLSAEG